MGEWVDVEKGALITEKVDRSEYHDDNESADSEDEDEGYLVAVLWLLKGHVLQSDFNPSAVKHASPVVYQYKATYFEVPAPRASFYGCVVYRRGAFVSSVLYSAAFSERRTRPERRLKSKILYPRRAPMPSNTMETRIGGRLFPRIPQNGKSLENRSIVIQIP